MTVFVVTKRWKKGECEPRSYHTTDREAIRNLRARFVGQFDGSSSGARDCRGDEWYTRTIREIDRWEREGLKGNVEICPLGDTVYAIHIGVPPEVKKSPICVGDEFSEMDRAIYPVIKVKQKKSWFW